MGRPKGSVGMKWDEGRERELLLAIIKQVQPSPTGLDWASIVAAMGGDATENACKLKFSKLKGTDGAGKGHTPGTPAKGGKKRKTEADDEESEAPVKKAKSGKVKVKGEEDEE